MRLMALGGGYFKVFQFRAKFGRCPKSHYLVSSPSPLLIKKIPAERTTVQHFFLHVDFPRSCGQLGCGNWLGHLFQRR